MSRPQIQNYLFKAGLSAQVLSEYDLDFLSISERELITIFCTEIYKASWTRQKSNHKFVQEYREKIVEVLKNASLTYLRKGITKPSISETFKQYKTPSQSNFKVHQLTDKKKQFYARLSELEFLNQDFKATQKFYDERVEKIKEDSSCYFNTFTVKEVIKDYIKENPDRMYKPKNILEAVDQDLFGFGEESLSALSSKSQPFFFKCTKVE